MLKLLCVHSGLFLLLIIVRIIYTLHEYLAIVDIVGEGFTSADFIFSWLQRVVNSFPAFFSLVFSTLQYLRGLGLSVIVATISTIENHHCDFSSSQMALTWWSLKNLNDILLILPYLYAWVAIDCCTLLFLVQMYE